MRILFIVNPMSGGYSKRLLNYPKKYLDLGVHSYDIACTSYAGHAELIAQKSDADIIVAVGGDGTVNEVGRALLGSNQILGIIPCGSGNGLARHLGITNHRIAFDALNRINTIQMDAGLINGHVFFCTCGVGLDAEVSMLFSTSKKRGLITYCIDTIRVWRNYKPQDYTITVDGITHNESAVLITFGNANQWGNNAYITPLASICDGMLDVTLMHDFGIYNIPRIVFQLITGKLNNNRIVNHYRGHEIMLHRLGVGPAHFDGDPLIMDSKINVSISDLKLSVIFGNKSRL